MSLPEPVMEAATKALRDTLGKLLEDPTLMKLLLEEQVDLLVASGQLVPREQLHIGVGFELAPPGLLEGARGVLAAFDEVDLEAVPQPLIASIVLLSEALNPPAAEDETEDETDDEADDDEAEAEPEEQRCVVCEKVVDPEQALASMTRFRAVVCKKDMANYKPPRKKAAANG